MAQDDNLADEVGTKFLGNPISIEDIYEANNVLEKDAGSNNEENNKLMNQLITTIYKGNNKQKSLAIQLIIRHLKKFPVLRSEAFNAILEATNKSSNDPLLLKIARSSLVQSSKFSESIADLVSTIITDFVVRVNVSDKTLWIQPLTESFNQHPKVTLEAIFTVIDPKLDASVPSQFINLILNDFRKKSETEKWTKDIETFFVQELVNVLPNCDKKDLEILIPSLCQRIRVVDRPVKVKLLEKFIEKSALTVPFEPTKENYQWLAFVLKQSLLICSTGVPSTQLVEYTCLNVIDHISNFQIDDSDLQLELLTSLALLCRYSGTLENISEILQSMYNGLLLYLPLPEDNNLENLEDHSNLQLDVVESYLFAFHKLASQQVEFLMDGEKVKDFRKRLQFAAHCARNHLKVLTSSKKAETEMDEDQKHWRATAIKTVKNIDVLVRDLMHVPPSYKSNCQLSSESSYIGTTKRQFVSDSDDSSPKKKAKSNQSIYTPPTGKFSERAGTFQHQNRGRGRGFRGQRGQRFRGGQGRRFNRGGFKNVY
ncbi:DgyrCDS4633 [Dimorphilus gyrociliatus]|uniref:DgyrCDS4633 n=1 Tax=Dimorphilus gyrociliatus TaxID=2664684 RepID=A0A7I8VHL4_9ANNE|nr:DgyrCDS4633 [Dimorphilus gyrociliatus]